MKKYFVKVEFYGKKLRVEVDAENDFRAEMKVMARLNIISVEEEKKPEKDSMVDYFKDIFNIK